MIGLDTNILVRYVTQDDPRQSEAATRLVEGRCSSATPGWISTIVQCELVWVLRRAYGYPKSDVLAVLAQLLVTSEIRLEDDAAVRLALDAYRDGGADFSDYLMVLRNQDAGCDKTYSFDTRLTKHQAADSPAAYSPK